MKKSNLPRRAWATVLAVCAHLLALLALGWRIPRMTAPSPSGDRSVAMQVTLLRPAPRPRERLVAAAPPAPSPAAPGPSSRVLIAPTPGAPSLAAPIQSPPAPVAPEAAPDGQHLRDALRGLLGCADPGAYRLTHEEREACDRRLAAAKPAPVGPEFSGEELAQFNADKQDPILIRKTHNGCLPHLGDRPASGGGGVATRSGATTTYGLSCSRSF